MKTLGSIRFDDLLADARDSGASDVHLCPGYPPMVRIDGELHAHGSKSFSDIEIGAIMDVALDTRGKELLSERGDVTTSADHSAAGRIRIHAYRASGSSALAIRLLARSIPALESLMLPPVVATIASRNHGLAIFTGPTGSGKSTMLASLIDRVNRTRSKHIITVEDPIEYRHAPERSRISQREVGKDTVSFESALASALRSDPDIILLGEMRDRETMRAALTAAETGHFVLATLHTGTAAESIDRITGSFDGAEQEQVRCQLAATLTALVCMRLVRRSEHAGRRAAVEILTASDAVRNAIRERKAHQLRNIIATSRSAGMMTLEMHLNDLIGRGDVEYDEACAATDRAYELKRAGQAA